MQESEKWKVKSLSRVRLFANPWTAAHQAPPSMGFSRQEYWSGVPLPLTPYQNIIPFIYVEVFLEYFISIVLDGKIVIYLKTSDFFILKKERKRLLYR